MHQAVAYTHLQALRSSQSEEASGIWLGKTDMDSFYIQEEASVLYFSTPVPLTSKASIIAQLLPLKQTLVLVTTVSAAASTVPCT